MERAAQYFTLLYSDCEAPRLHLFTQTDRNSGHTFFSSPNRHIDNTFFNMTNRRRGHTSFSETDGHYTSLVGLTGTEAVTPSLEHPLTCIFLCFHRCGVVAWACRLGYRFPVRLEASRRLRTGWRDQTAVWTAWHSSLNSKTMNSLIQADFWLASSVTHP